MATPSGLFTFEDVTLNGFNYKRTTQTAGDIFPLYSELDRSIAYTLPQMSSYRTMTPTLINKAFPQRSYTRGNYYQEHYSSSPGGTLNRWSTIGQVHGTGDDDESCVIYWTFTDQDDEYYFNGNEGNAVIGDSSIKFISGFDISHVIFESSITGYTKAQFDAYKSDGSNQTASTINLEDLIANPDNYYIKKFEIHPVCYWDDTNHEWKNGSPVYLTCLVDGGALIQGVSMSGCVLFCDQQTSGSDLGTNCDNYHIWSNTQNYVITDSTQYARKGGIPVGLNSNNPYSLGTKGDWFFEPTMTTDELDTYIRSQVSASTNNTTNPKQIFTTGHGEAWGYDNYNVSKKGGSYSDVPGAFYYSKYDKVLTYVGYGTKLSEFLASAGCYFHIGNNNANYGNVLNTDSITPDTLHLREDIGLGVMADDGTTTGTWVIGEDIEDYEGINKKGDVVHPDFDPNPPGPDQNPWDVDPETYGWGGNNVGGMVRYYLLTKTQMENLVSAMGSSNNWVIDYLNNIVSCFIVPNSGIFFDAPVSTTVKFRIDNNTEWDTGVACKRISGVVYKSGGTIEIPHCTNTFLDFEPYSDYSVYIPFCGRIPIKGNVVCGREIKVTYYPDVPTCSVTAVVTCGDSTVAIAKGQFGSMIPVTSNGADRKTAAVISDVSNIITGLGMGIAGASTGNVGLVVAGSTQFAGGILNGAKDTMQSYAYSSGSSGDTSFFAAGTRCYYYANYLQLDEVVNNSIFGHTVGYLCNKVGTLSSYHGFTVCANPHINFSATSIEKEEIKRLLEEGVILP